MHIVLALLQAIIERAGGYLGQGDRVRAHTRCIAPNVILTQGCQWQERQEKQSSCQHGIVATEVKKVKEHSEQTNIISLFCTTAVPIAMLPMGVS